MSDDTIEVFDERGRQVRVPKAEYVKNVMGWARQNWNNAEALRPVMMQLLQGGFAEQALEISHQICKLSNENVQDLYWRAAAMAESGLLEEAAKAFDDLREDAAYAADQARAAAGLAQVRVRQGQIEPACKLLEEAVDLDPTNTGLMIGLFDTFEARGDGETAKNRIMQLASGNKNGSAPHRALAHIAATRNEFEEVHKHAEAAVAAAAPEDREDVLGDLSALYGQNGMPERAVALLEPHAATLQNPQCIMNLVQAYADSGRKADAKKLLERLRKELPPDAKPMIDAKLRELG